MEERKSLRTLSEPADPGSPVRDGDSVDRAVRRWSLIGGGLGVVLGALAFPMRPSVNDLFGSHT